VKKKVLFLCIGNSCRSQMAEGFARRYGSDVMEVESAGLAPASIVQPLTKKVMEAKNINIDEQFPKDLTRLSLASFDIIVNISGARLPARTRAEVREWKVEDPIGKPEELYTKVCNQIENLVMQLILELRPRRTPTPVLAHAPAGRGSRR
jgi:arsenate reductase (thioredoxin)